jgi:hypothetical protein
MNGCGKSDRPIVPGKQPNKGGSQTLEEAVEGRGLAKGNLFQQNKYWTQSQVKGTYEY